MVSGELPFRGDSALQTALMRLHPTRPPALSKLVPGLPARWEAAIFHCLQLDPTRRPASAVAAVAEISEPAAGVGVQLRWPWPATWSRWVLAVVVALLALVLGALAIWRFSERPLASSADSLGGPGGPGGAGVRLAVAVLGLENLSRQADLDYIDHALSEMLPTEIAGALNYRVVPSEQVRRARADLGLRSAQLLAPEGLARIRRLTGADRVVVGSYLASPGATGKRRLRFDVAVHDGVSGGLLERFKEEADESALLSSVEGLGAHAWRAALGGEDVTPAAAREMAAARPRSIEGLQAYTEGLSRLRVADAPGALRELEQAVAAEPDNALVHSALASAWLTLGFPEPGARGGQPRDGPFGGSARTATLGDRSALPRSRRRARRGDRALSPRLRSRA